MRNLARDLIGKLKLDKRRVWLGSALSTGVVFLVVVLLVGAFGRVFVLGRTTAAATPIAPAPTAIPTPSPVPTVSLTTGAITWHSVTLPPGFPERIGTDLFWLAPGDGNTVYACFTPSLPTIATPTRYTPRTPALWITHDRAATWHQVQTRALTQQVGNCSIWVDSLDANVAVFGVIPPIGPQNPSGMPAVSFVTSDGGVTWRSIPSGWRSWEGYTRNGVTYTLRTYSVNSAYHTDVVVSRDGMATWRIVNPPPGADGAQGLWGDPATGHFLVLLNTGDIGSELWSTSDGGAHWRQWTIPAGYGWTAREAASGRPWLVCGSSYNASDHVHPSSVVCSADDGASWVTRPGIPPRAEWSQIIGIAHDGALLATGMQQPYDQADHVFYRLAPGASSWQLVAETPPDQLRYIPGPGNGVLWMGPGFYGGQYPGNRFYVADYSN